MQVYIVWHNQFSSVAQSCPTLCDPVNHSTPGLPVHHQLPEFTEAHLHWVGDAIQPSHPLLSPSPPAFSLSHIRVFSNESALCIRWPKYWSFSFSISPSNEYSGLISFRMDWLDLLAAQGTLKSVLQHHSSKASILWHSSFFIVQIFPLNICYIDLFFPSLLGMCFLSFFNDSVHYLFSPTPFLDHPGASIFYVYILL